MSLEESEHILQYMAWSPVKKEKKKMSFLGCDSPDLFSETVLKTLRPLRRYLDTQITCSVVERTKTAYCT